MQRYSTGKWVHIPRSSIFTRHQWFNGRKRPRRLAGAQLQGNYVYCLPEQLWIFSDYFFAFLSGTYWFSFFISLCFVCFVFCTAGLRRLLKLFFFCPIVRPPFSLMIIQLRIYNRYRNSNIHNNRMVFCTNRVHYHSCTNYCSLLYKKIK